MPRRPSPIPWQDRAMAFVDRRGVDECWPWTGAHTLNGYGQYSYRTPDGQVIARAHRLVYELLVGPIGEGLEIDHLCRVRDCVNPAHLEPVTRAENVRRANTLVVLAKKRPAWREHPMNRLALTPTETGKLLGLSTGSVYRAIRAGDIHAEKIAGRILVPVHALEQRFGKVVDIDMGSAA